MSNDTARDRMLELLADRAIFGLNEAEAAELRELETRFPEVASDNSFERAVAAYSVSTVGTIEQMPASLRTRLESTAAEMFGETVEVSEPVPALEITAPVTAVGFDKPGFSFSQWLGWGVAAVAAVLLAFNVWTTRMGDSPDVVQGPTPEPSTQAEPSAGERLRALVASANDLVRTKWSSPSEDGDVSGEVVWSDDKQSGFMTFKGLDSNDVSKETYQLWIFDESQDEATPIDGGVFDISSDGEVTVPIDAKLAVKNPKMFAVTVEKPGGVVVSKREKIVAIANV